MPHSWRYESPVTIPAAHPSFEGEAWVTYDTCYHRQAAASSPWIGLEWTSISIIRRSRSRQEQRKRCRFCLSKYHRASECYYAPNLPLARSFRAWQEEPIAPQQPPKKFSMSYRITLKFGRSKNSRMAVF